MVDKFFDKKSSGSGADAFLANRSATNQIFNLQMNFICRSLKKLRKEKSIRH